MSKLATIALLTASVLVGTAAESTAGKHHNDKHKHTGKRSGTADPNTGTLTFRIRSFHPNRVELALFSKSRNAYWRDGAAYSLTDYASHDVSISCIPDELICFGAWVENTSTFWGVGRDGKQTPRYASCAYCKGQVASFSLSAN